MISVEPATVEELNVALERHHYLGRVRSGGRLLIKATRDGELLGFQLWRHPTARRLPQDGTWLELSRWCLWGTKNAGSMMHGAVVKYIRANFPEVTTLVSYSDPEHGHTGALYRSCNWLWRPTWHRLRPPPTGNGGWGDGVRRSVKDRWIFELRPDPRRDEIVRVKDAAIVKKMELA